MERPDKTFIGRIERGFDFLGYHFGTDGLSVAKKTIEQFIARAIRPYEQEPEEACAAARLGSYVQRWLSRDQVQRYEPGVARFRGFNSSRGIALSRRCSI